MYKKYMFFLVIIIFLFSNVTAFLFSKINIIEIVKLDWIHYDYDIIWTSNKLQIKYFLSEDYIFEIGIDKIEDFGSFISLQLNIDDKFIENKNFYYMNTKNKVYFWAKGLRSLFLNSKSKVFRFNFCYNSSKQNDIKCIFSEDVSILYEYNRYNDTYSYLQYYIKDMNIDKAKSMVKSNYTPIIAIIDDWVFWYHSDLEWRYWINENEIDWNLNDDDGNWFVDDYYWWNFVDSNNDMSTKWHHWTSLAGIIWAITNNNNWIVWIVNDVKLMPIIACDSICNEDNLTSAIRYAVDNGADIINLSLWWDLIENNENLSNIIRYAVDNWVIIVSSAWNGFDLIWSSKWVDTDVHKIFPVCNENNITDIIWVSALSLFSDKTKNWLKAYWSNYWKCIDFSAPWDKIVSTSTVWAYSINDWTSFSTPIITWIIWLGFNHYGKVDREIIYKSLQASADKWYGIDAKQYIKELAKNLKK